MIEILVLIRLCKAMGKILRAKGRKPLGMQVALVVSWLGGEVLGGVLGAVIGRVRSGDAEPGFSLLPYGMALGGAALAAFVCFKIAKGMPDERAPEFTETDETQSWMLGDGELFK